MSVHYVRPYVPGQVTTPGFLVVCVPGMPAVEVTESLAVKLTELVVKKEYAQARDLLTWFSDSAVTDGQE